MPNKKKLTPININIFIETFVRYRKGKNNLEEAMLALHESSGLSQTNCREMLLGSKRENIISLTKNREKNCNGE